MGIFGANREKKNGRFKMAEKKGLRIRKHGNHSLESKKGHGVDNVKIEFTM